MNLDDKKKKKIIDWDKGDDDVTDYVEQGSDEEETHA